MAELTQGCCAPEAQQTCCEPSHKSSCCGEAHPYRCGCDAGATSDTAKVALDGVRETVRERYASAAQAAASGAACCSPADDAAAFGSSLYAESDETGAPEGAVLASLGGVPTAVADLTEGETVLDLGSGAGADVLISARRVAPAGTAIGLDMTDEMLELARANAAQAGLENVEFIKGYIEDIPLPQDSVDVVISNCVINLSVDKRRVFREVARVLRPGGRVAVSDVIADPEMDDATRVDMRQQTGCVAGAFTQADFERALADAGFENVEIRETHRVHEHAGSAIIRARKAGALAPSIPIPVNCDDPPGRIGRAGRLAHVTPQLTVATRGTSSGARARVVTLQPTTERDRMSTAPELRTYVIRRRGGWASPDELQAAAARSAQVGDDEMSADIRWIRSYFVIEADGRLGTVCIYQASSPGRVREHAARAGLPADEITEVADTVVVRPDPVPVAA